METNSPLLLEWHGVMLYVKIREAAARRRCAGAALRAARCESTPHTRWHVILLQMRMPHSGEECARTAEECSARVEKAKDTANAFRGAASMPQFRRRCLHVIHACLRFDTKRASCIDVDGYNDINDEDGVTEMPRAVVIYVICRPTRRQLLYMAAGSSADFAVLTPRGVCKGGEQKSAMMPLPCPKATFSSTNPENRFAAAGATRERPDREHRYE